VRPIKVVIADDHSLMLAAARRVLSERDDVEIVGEATSGDEVLPLVRATRPDIVLLDVGMPVMDGIECAKQLRELLPQVRILMLSAYGDQQTIEAAQRAGANGYVLKSVTAVNLVEVLMATGSKDFVLAGFPSRETGAAELTERERAVLQAVADGLTNRQIARELWVTEQTVKFHLKNLFRKLDVSNRADAARRAREDGLVWSGARRSAASS
jgi:DNA-binding NarL/FixJ family response regulator